MTRSLLLLPLLLLIGCPGADDDDSATPDEGVPDFVFGQVRLIDALSNGRVEAADVSLDGEVLPTDDEGQARFEMASQTDFDFEITGADLQPTLLQGNSGIQDFTFTTFVGSTDVHDGVVGQLGLPPRDPARGTLVVAMDTPALQAVEGAAASISVDSDTPFIFVDGVPTLAEDGLLVFQAAGFVTFANVEPGDVVVTATAPPNTGCLSFPGLAATADFRTYSVRAGAVTVAQFICS